MLEKSYFSEQSAETISTIHHALRAPRRRLTILVLIHYYPQLRVKPQRPTDLNSIAVRKITREIVSIEKGVAVDHATGDKYKNIYNSLVQTHLPALAETGALKFNQTRKTVTPRQNLLPLATTAAISATVAELVFYASLSEPFTAGTRTTESSIDD